MAGHVLMSCMKDEGPFVLEFVAHHLVLGFDRVLIASNDCRDGTDALLVALARAGAIGHVENLLQPGEIPQHSGYAKLRKAYGVDRADWVMMLDADEFLFVAGAGGRVQDLTAQADGVDIIALNAMTFGSVPGTVWQPGRVCADFPFRLGLRDRANAAVKSLTRDPARFRGAHNHHLVGYRGTASLRVMRGDGSRFDLAPDVPLWTRLRNFALPEIGHALAHYNHYAVKTWDSYQLRRDRGRGAVAEMTADNQRHTESYFAARARASIPDDRIARHAPAVVAMMAQLLADPRVAQAQADTEARYLALLKPYR